MKRAIVFQSVEEKKVVEAISKIMAANYTGLEVDLEVATKLTADGDAVPLYLAFVTFDELNDNLNVN